MTTPTLPHLATTQQTCDWLSAQTTSLWTLTRLLENSLTPYVELEKNTPALADYAELFTDGVTAYFAPIIYAQDTQRLAAGSSDVLIRFSRDADKIAIQLQAPGITLPLDALRFFQSDITQLADNILHPKPPEPEVLVVPMESKKGIEKAQVIAVFGSLVKMDLDKALTAGSGIFGDDGARVRKNSRAGKNSYLWNPVTLALGLHDVHKVPMAYLKKTFATQVLLREWKAAWLESLALLGE